MARRAASALVREAIMRVLVDAMSSRALGLLAGPAIAFAALTTPAQAADVIYERTYQQTYREIYPQPYELRRFSHPAPAYAAPPFYGPPPRYVLERYDVAPPPAYVAPRPYVARRHVYGGSVYAQPDPYPRGYIQVDRPPPVIIAPRRGVREYPYVVPQEDVVVETVRPYRWRWDEAPDPLF
jgi:hypothetical protein